MGIVPAHINSKGYSSIYNEQMIHDGYGWVNKTAKAVYAGREITIGNILN